MELLVSVKNLPEACIAVDASASIVDVKEPNRGPLGRADAETLNAIGRKFGWQTRLSAAMGEFVEFRPKAFNDSCLNHFSYVKFGLSNWKPELFPLLADTFLSLPTHLKPVVVIYGDHSLCNAAEPEQVFDWLTTFLENHPNSVPYVLFDTFQKQPDLNLFSHVSVEQMENWIGRLHAMDLQVVVAGSLREDDLESARGTGADLVGIRGAACANRNRQSELDAKKLNRFMLTMFRSSTNSA